jgi:hypothetical protein
MKIYEDISRFDCNQTIAYLGNDVKSQEYVYLDVNYGQHINELNSNNISFVPIFSFKKEVVLTFIFKPVINKNFDNKVLDILMDNNCAWLFHNESILLCFPEDNDTCIDLSAAIERSNALDVLYKLKQ